jgi:hypothetical protein
VTCLLEGGVALGPKESQRRRLDGRAHPFEHVQRLKAATNNVIEQHLNSNYNTKIAGKRDRELEQNRRRLASEHEDGDAKVDAKAHCCSAHALEQEHVEDLANRKGIGHRPDFGEAVCRLTGIRQAPACGHGVVDCAAWWLRAEIMAPEDCGLGVQQVLVELRGRQGT